MYNYSFLINFADKDNNLFVKVEYYKYYVQKEADGSEVKELGEDFGFYETESKFYGGNAVKDIPKRDWNDEDGDDEFVPDEPKYKAFEMSVKFGYKGDFGSANAKMKALQDYLSKGTMKVYDSYNRIGRQNVRFVEISDDAELVRDKEDGDILIITIKLKANDPRTEITLTK